MKYDHKNVTLARNLRKAMTPWESKLWYRFLRGYSVRFQRQKCIDQYIVDFYCAKASLIVELDGSGHYDPEQMKKDQMRTSDLERHGFCVLRFSNTDIDRNFNGVCTVIEEEVQKRLHP